MKQGNGKEHRAANARSRKIQDQLIRQTISGVALTRLRPVLYWFGTLLFTLYAPVQAQQSAKFARLGIMGGGSSSANAARIEAFRQGLRELGYQDGKNIVVEQRWADGKVDRLPALAAELVRFKADVLLSAGPTVTRAAKDANITTPIVMGFDDDPVGSGFVASLARPGGNITGLSTLSPDLSGKQLELLTEIVPTIARVAVLGSVIHPGTAQTLKAIESAARSVKLQVQYLDVAEPKQIEAAFTAARKERADAVLVLTSVATNTERPLIVALAAKSRLPAIYYTAEWANGGGLLTYGASYTDLFRRAAGYVDKILKGAKPVDLPVEQPKKFELVINLNAAKEIGLAIPPGVLARADRVIK